MLSEDDKLALLGLVIRYHKTWLERDRDHALQLEIAKRIAGYATQMGQLTSAFAVFGFGTKKEDWAKMSQEIGVVAFNNALKKAEAEFHGVEFVPLPSPPPPSSLQNRPEPSPEPKTIDAEIVEMRDDESVKDLVIEQLKIASPEGMKAAQIEANINAVRSTQLHEKTVGMTLYRLSLDGRVRRDGRTWFFVPPAAETENPGGEAGAK